MTHAFENGLFRFALLTLSLSAAGRAQLIVQYGDPVQNGTITQPAQTVTHLLINAGAGDIVRFTFASQSCCGPTYYYHQLDLRQGTTSVATIDGLGITTITLPAAGTYSIDVRARNLLSTGWYAFQVDRVVDPVAAWPTAFNWINQGSIAQTAEFATYTFSAAAGSSAQLQFASQSCCGPTYYYHYAEILDATGTSIASVTGLGNVALTIPSTGFYTLFVAARNYQSTGWFSAQLSCQTWPGQPCGGVAYSKLYGTGWPGTNGVPSLTASAPPALGSTIIITAGNCAGQPAPAFLLLGLGSANIPMSGYGGSILVDPMLISAYIAPMPAPDFSFPLGIPSAPWLSGWGFTLQSIVMDNGAQPGGAAFSRGLALIL